jgi:hypothetical protein
MDNKGKQVKNKKVVVIKKSPNIGKLKWTVTPKLRLLDPNFMEKGPTEEFTVKWLALGPYYAKLGKDRIV